MGDDLSEEFLISNWPMNAMLQDTLDKIKATYIMVPIPAYDADGHLIQPT
ncbi:hypothetical protein V8B97DRAFT_2009609 [Scleroderma yunnanense]